MKKVIFVFAVFIIGINSFAQNGKKILKTEILEYVSAVYDPISEETQVKFRNSNNESRVFYYSKSDDSKLEEKFFNPPPVPFVETGKNTTKTELVGSKYKMVYYALTEAATASCCFKIQSCETLK